MLAGVAGLIGVSIWAMIVLSRPARTPRLLRVSPSGAKAVVAG